MSLILAILALSVLIVVHESGHYFVARWSKMRVERFSLGFGPAILSWKRGETTFQLAPVPFGGFVQITGMNPHEEYDAEDPRVYPNRPTYQRFLTIFAGPFTNILFSVFLMFPVYALAGESRPEPYYTATEILDGPAKGVLEPGDRIVKVDGHAIPAGENGFVDAIQLGKGAPVVLTIERKGATQDVTITPRYVEADKRYRIGVGLQQDETRHALPLPQAAELTVRYPFEASAMILSGIWDVVTRKAPLDAGGPILMTSLIRKQIQAGWVSALQLLALLNVYLGLFNLLPLPALDGGRLVFLGYELATRRRPNPRVEAAVHMAGFLVLALMLVLVTFKDISRLIP